MRIYFNILLIALFGLSVALHAQIKTYDMKYFPGGDVPQNGIFNLYQISSTRTVAMTNLSWGRSSVHAINSEGMTLQKWTTIYDIERELRFFNYDPQSNILVFFCFESFTDSLKKVKRSIRLVLLDSNLSEKRNIILDSTVTGIPTKFDYGKIRFSCSRLLDSSTLLVSSSYPAKIGKEQLMLHISKDGQIVGRASIVDTSGFISYIPQFQLPSGNLLFQRTIYNSKFNYYTRTLVISDSSFNFVTKPVIDSSDIYRGIEKIIPTRDGGICLGYYDKNKGGIVDVAVIVKYDKNFQKQWIAYVPGDDITGGNFELIESKDGSYYTATSGYDTAVTHSQPKQYLNWPQCFQDIVLSRLDSSGSLLFSAFYGSELCTDSPYSMIQDSDGGIIISGEYGTPLYHSPCETLCNEQITSWLFKVDTLGLPAKRRIVMGLEEQAGDASGVRLYPNPASGILTVALGRSEYFTSIEVLDLSGRVLYTSGIEGKKQLLISIDISAFASGSYYCRLRANSHFIIRPFVIQK